jgi:hypothetical protein
MPITSQIGSSSLIKPGVVDSAATRPASPFEGQMLYEKDTDRVLVYNGSAWVMPGTSTLVTSLPSSPVDGQIIDYVADSTNGVVWRFRYRSASTSAYKWEFIGGPPNFSYVGPNNYFGTRQTTTSLTFADLSTVGPSFVTPFAGDWDCTYNFIAETTNTSTNARIWVTGDSTSLGWDLGDSQVYGGGQINGNHVATIRRTSLASGSTIKLQYAVSNAGTTAYFWNRRLYITPVRIG